MLYFISSDSLIVHYEYDELNQLKRENNVATGETVVYTYDLGGNIEKKEIYAYESGNLPQQPSSTVNYGYSDENWKDKLTSYNGQNIMYDSIGKATYSALTYNCKHTSIDILMQGDFGEYDDQYKEELTLARKKNRPNMAFGHFTTFHDNEAIRKIRKLEGIHV